MRRSAARVDGRPQARGFTLVELLVVITIIGILVSLLMPAVQSAREAARKTQCDNNLYQMGRAVLAHEQAQRFFPTGGWGWNWVGDPDRGFSLKQQGGWIYNILPYLDQQNLHDMGMGQSQSTKYAQAGIMIGTPIAMINCPSRRQAICYVNAYGQSAYINANPCPGFVARSDYGANQGDASIDEINGGPPDIATGDGGGWTWLDPIANGITGVSYIRSQIKAANITDGPSCTYFAGEKYLNPDHYYDAQDPADNECAYTGWDNDNYRDASNSFTPIQDTAGYSNTKTYGGVHPSGCQFVFCDGSVHNISYSIDPETHRRLSNRCDGLTIDDGLWLR